MGGAASILTGLLSGMNEGGGTHQLARLLAQKVGRYDPYSDPLFFQDLGRAAQLGETGKSHFLKEYSPYLTYKIPEGAMGPVRMTDEQRWNQLTGQQYVNPMTNLRTMMQTNDPLGDYSWLPDVNIDVRNVEPYTGYKAGSLNKELQNWDAKNYAETALGNDRQASANYTTAITDPTVQKILQGAFAEQALGNSRQADANFTTAITNPTLNKINQEGYAEQALGNSRQADADLTNFELDFNRNSTVNLGQVMQLNGVQGWEAFQNTNIPVSMLKDIGLEPWLLDLQRGVEDSEIFANTAQGNRDNAHANLYGWEAKVKEGQYPYLIGQEMEQLNTQRAETGYKQAQTNQITKMLPYLMDELLAKNNKTNTEANWYAQIAQSQVNANNALAGERVARGSTYGAEDGVNGLSFAYRTPQGQNVYKNKAGLLVDEKGNPVRDAQGNPLMMNSKGEVSAVSGLTGLNFQSNFKATPTKQYSSPVGPPTPQGKTQNNGKAVKAQSSDVVNALYQLFGTNNKTQILNYLSYATPDVKKSFQQDWGWTYEEILALLRK